MPQGSLFTKRIAHIARYTQYHMDEVLKPFNLSSGSYPFLLALWGDEGINMEKISKKVNVDKAMSTRTIQKLVHLGYIEKLTDTHDSRTCRLYLTDQARAAVPTIKEELALWVDTVTQDLTEAEKGCLDSILDKVLERAKEEKL